MTDPHQCERCGESGTVSNLFKIKEYRNSAPIGWGNPERLHALHLCGGCAESLESTVGEWLDGPQERGRDDD